MSRSLECAPDRCNKVPSVQHCMPAKSYFSYFRISIRINALLIYTTMGFKKSMLIAMLAFGIASACGEKKNKDDHSHSQAEERVKEMSTETSKEEVKIEAAKRKVADSLKKVDSLRQVKEHGHAH